MTSPGRLEFFCFAEIHNNTTYTLVLLREDDAMKKRRYAFCCNYHVAKIVGNIEAIVYMINQLINMTGYRRCIG